MMMVAKTLLVSNEEHKLNIISALHTAVLGSDALFPNDFGEDLLVIVVIFKKPDRSFAGDAGGLLRRRDAVCGQYSRHVRRTEEQNTGSRLDVSGAYQSASLSSQPVVD